MAPSHGPWGTCGFGQGVRVPQGGQQQRAVLCGGWDGCRHPLTLLCFPSEAAPYLPVEEKSPLFTIQREGIEDNGALYRLNRLVEGLLRGGGRRYGVPQSPGCTAAACRMLWDPAVSSLVSGLCAGWVLPCLVPWWCCSCPAP